MPARGITTLQSVIAGLAQGAPHTRVKGSGKSGPRGIEAILEFNGVYLNVQDWMDTFLVTSIQGLEDADIRDNRQVNPGEDGETPFPAWYGGRTLVISGKVLAGTLDKLRDMNQGLRGAFADLNTEYPLIFHGNDPQRALYIMCKKNAPLQLPDQQTMPNEHQRQFAITVRASWPRFLSVVKIKDALNTAGTTPLLTYLDFTVANAPTIEDFWLPTGISAGYIQHGLNESTGSGYMMPKALKRNWIANPRAYSDIWGIWSSTGHTIAQDNTSGVSSTHSVKLTTKTTDPADARASVLWAPYYNTSWNGVYPPSAGLEPFPGQPMVVGGETMRITGWFKHGGVEASTYARIGLYVVDKNGNVICTTDLLNLFDNGDPNNLAPAANTWKRFDTTYKIPATCVGWPVVWAAIFNRNAPFTAARTINFTDMMLDIDDGSVWPEFVSANMYGCMAEGLTNKSPSRRWAKVANWLPNPSAWSDTYGVTTVNGTVTRLTGQVGPPDSPSTQTSTAFQFTTAANATAYSAAVSVAQYNAAAPPGTQDQQSTVGPPIPQIPGKRYVFSGYFKKHAVSDPARDVQITINYFDANGNPAGIPSFRSATILTETDTWQRSYLTATAPTGAVWASVSIAWLNSQAAGGEHHDFGWMMFHEGEAPRRFINVTTQIDVEYIAASPVGAPQQTPTLGPIAQMNYALDPDADADPSVQSWGTLPYPYWQGNLSVDGLSKVPVGGYGDNGAYARVPYATGSGSMYGTEHAVGDHPGLVAGESFWSAGAMVRSEGRPMLMEVEFDWYDVNNTWLSWNRSQPITVSGDWTQLKLENVKAPTDARSASVWFLCVDAKNGDVFNLDKIVITEWPSIDEYFDGSSEWSEWANPFVPLDSITRRYNYHTWQPPRTFTEAQQTVKVMTGNGSMASPIHIALSYFDPDNQIYAGLDQNRHMGIWKRQNGVETALNVDTVNTLALNSNWVYYLRTRMSKGIVTIELWNNIDPADTTQLNPFPMRTVTYALTTSEKAFFQDSPHAIRLGIQERGAIWKIDEWRYTDVSEPSGWTWYRGAGEVAVVNNRLVPLVVNSIKLFTRAGLPFKVADGTVRHKFRYDTQPTDVSPMAGPAVKVLDRDNFLAALVVGRATNIAGLASLNLVKMDGGVQTTLFSSEIGRLNPGTDAWVQCIIIGNNITVQRWNTDPALGGSPFDTLSWTLTGADATKFGAGVKGEFGIYWYQPATLSASIDDFKLEMPTFDDIVFVKHNEGNYQAQTTIELTGPMSNPRVTNETNGTSTLINTVIPTGETWVIEQNGSTKRVYRKSDQANRSQYFDDTSTWVTLEPNNVANNIRFTATGLAAGWDVAMTHQHTYM